MKENQLKPKGMTDKKYKQILKFIKDYDKWKNGGWKPGHRYIAPCDYGLAIGEIEQVRKLLKKKQSTPDLLKDKIEKLIVDYTSISGANGSFISKEIIKVFRERLERVIKFHEDRIEELIKRYKRIDEEYNHYPTQTMDEINKEYESIMAIEKEFEGVI